MQTIFAENVREAYKLGMDYLRDCGKTEKSRVGDVIVSPVPVCTMYQYPRQRVLLNAQRDANPFFHFMEGIWMLSGSNDGRFLNQFIGNFTERFADYEQNGERVILHGAYGYRWRRHWGIDQIHHTIQALRADPTTRRCVIAMWDPGDDSAPKRDLPCNTNIFLRILDGRLDMMVNCRSNDIIWGAYGANAVHMSMLQEYIATAVGVRVGVYFQNSWNFHAYRDVFDKNIPHIQDATWMTPYGNTVPLVDNPETFLGECILMVNSKNADFSKYRNSVFIETAFPMLSAHRMYKGGNLKDAITMAYSIGAHDWRQACVEWLERRLQKAVKEVRRDAGEVNYESESDRV